MEKQSLTDLTQDHLERAERASSHRSIQRVTGESNGFRQLLVAFADGGVLTEHENPGQATLQVLHGRVRLTAGSETWEGAVGDLLVVPQRRHSLVAVGPAAVLLSVVPHE